MDQPGKEKGTWYASHLSLLTCWILGTYHINLDTIGGSAPCQITSSDFEIKASSSSSINQDDTDRAIQAIKSSATQTHANDQKDQDWEEALDEIDGYIRKNHSNDVNEDGDDKKDDDGDLPDFETYIEVLYMNHFIIQV